jgi:hypothetical protein
MTTRPRVRYMRARRFYRMRPYRMVGARRFRYAAPGYTGVAPYYYNVRPY